MNGIQEVRGSIPLRSTNFLLPEGSMLKAFEVRAWRYPLDPGWVVLAGKTDEDNEALSLRVARANDYWFHVHGVPGSHVVLQGPEGVEPDKSMLKVAASIAAYHSKARAAGIVPVSCTRAQNVSKPRGAKVGTVQIRKETTLKVRPGLPPNSSPAD